VLDVMRWVLFRAPDEQGHSSGRVLARIKTLLNDLDDFQRSLLVLVAKSVGDEDSLTLRDAADELGHPPQQIGEAVRALNQTAAWGREVVTLRPETTVGVRGHHGKISVLTMSPETARAVRTAMRSPSVPEG
jgi:hypothetical protein